MKSFWLFPEAIACATFRQHFYKFKIKIKHLFLKSKIIFNKIFNCLTFLTFRFLANVFKQKQLLKCYKKIYLYFEKFISVKIIGKKFANFLHPQTSSNLKINQKSYLILFLICEKVEINSNILAELSLSGLLILN